MSVIAVFTTIEEPLHYNTFAQVTVSRSANNAVAQEKTFSVVHGEVQGHPLVAMIDMALRDLSGKQAFPFFLSLSTNLVNPTADGLPTRGDADNLNKWEETVEARLRPITEFVFLGRVTWNGYRELLYYVAKQQPAVEALRGLSGTRPSSLSCDRDEKWVKADYWLNRR